MHFSERSQRIVVWWAIAFTVIYGICLVFLCHMVPPPSPTLSASEIAQFYREHHDSIRVGAVICGWASAFMMPLWCVIGIQVYRQEEGKPIWTVLAITGGAMMSIFLVLPPIMWGAAAFTPDRAVDVTAGLHELAMLTLTTTDQYYIFAWVAVVVMCFRPQRASHTPFPRWFGYFTAWIATMFEAGAFAFLPRTGPLAWNGVLVFWSPLSLFGLWIAVMSFLLLRALRGQRAEAGERTEAVESPVASASAATPGAAPSPASPSTT